MTIRIALHVILIDSFSYSAYWVLEEGALDYAPHGR